MFHAPRRLVILLLLAGVACSTASETASSDAGVDEDAGTLVTPLAPSRCRTAADCGAGETCFDCPAGGLAPLCRPLVEGGSATTGLCIAAGALTCQDDTGCLALARHPCLSFRCVPTATGGICDPVQIPDENDQCLALVPAGSTEWGWDRAYLTNRCATLYAAVATPGCADPPPGSLDADECAMFYEDLQRLCVEVVLTYWDCAEHLTGSDYECHADGTTGTRNGLCQAELDAIVACSPDV